MHRFMRLVLSAALAVISLMQLQPAKSLKAAAPAATDIDTIVNQLLDLYDVPGVAVAVVQGGRVIQAKGYGYADVDKKRPVTDKTAFAIGSVSKSFTTLAIAQLVDARKLDLDAPIVRYLPDFKLSDPEATKTLTVRQVISHSSGLPRSDERLGLTLDSRKQAVDDIANISLTAKPGERWQYANQNFVLAGYLIEQMTGQTWEHYTQEHILKALGLKATTPGMESLFNTPDHAVPYKLDVLKTVAAWEYTPDAMKALEIIAPAGSITSTIVDMAQYARFQLGNGTFGGKRIVSKKLLDELHTRQISVLGMPEGNVLAAVSLTQDIGYGMGWFTETYQGHKLVSHGGEVPGYTANVTLAPDDQLGIVILSNLNAALPFIDALRISLVANALGLDNSDIAQQANHHFHIDPARYKVNAAAARTFKGAKLDKYVGAYSGPAGSFTVQVIDGKLHLLLGPQNVELVPYAEDAFLVNETWGISISFKFKSDDVAAAFQDGVEIGQRQSKTVSEYKDPKGRFSLTIPAGLTVMQIGELAVMQSTTPPGTFVVAAETATGKDLKEDVQKWLVKYAQIKDEVPFNTRPVPVNGQDWVQYLYQLPDGQLLVVVATRQAGTAYFISLKAKSNDVVAFTANFNMLLLSFKISKP
jgi:CubicO group peptidase (beta-lactamase class C family)